MGLFYILIHQNGTLLYNLKPITTPIPMNIVEEKKVIDQ